MKKIYFCAMLLISGIATSQETSHKITVVKDINYSSSNPSTSHSFPSELTAFNGKIYFGADDSNATNTGGVDYSKELWVSDGTTEGTEFVKNINTPIASGDTDRASNPSYFFELNNRLYFKAIDGTGVTGYNTYTTDGTDRGTLSLNNDFNNAKPIILNGKAYMRAFSVGGSLSPFYEFDGQKFIEIEDTGNGSVNAGSNYIGLDDNSILINLEYLEEGVNTVGRELYIYDLTNKNFTLIKNFDDANGNSSLTYMTKVGDVVYFVYDNDLWVTDGTTNGTIKVAGTSEIGGVRSLYLWNGKLFFEADAGGGDLDQLYVYDPSTDTSTDISDLSVTHDPVHFAAPGDGYLYYAGKIVAGGSYILWRTDGVTTTPILEDLIDSVDDIAVLNHKLYFEASYIASDDQESVGRELFTYSNDELNTLDTSTFELESSLSIYPNPSTNLLNVKSTLEGEINYTIYNILGKQVLNGTIKNNVINHNLTSGLYLLKLDNGSNAITKKIIVKE